MPCAFADPPPASALPSLTAPSLREPAPPSPRSLYVRGIILGYKRYVDGPTAEPLPRVARRARRERRKTRLVFRARRAPRRRPGRPTRDSKRGNDGVSRAVRESFGRRSPSGTHTRGFVERRRGVPARTSTIDVDGRTYASRRRRNRARLRLTHLHHPVPFPTPQCPHEPDEPHVSDQAGERERV